MSIKYTSLWFFLSTVIPTVMSTVPSHAAERAASRQETAQVIHTYLRATYGRDFVEAYRYISSEDRKVRDLNRYVQQRGAFSGFSLEAAKKLGEFVEITPLQQTQTGQGVQVAVKYRVPDPKKLAPLLLNWDPFRLNSLSAAARQQLLDALDKKQRDGSLDMSVGEENFELVKDGSEWRIFLNWAAGVKVPLKVDLTKTTDLDVTVSRNEFVLQPGEIFEVSLKIRNKTAQTLVARIGHIVAPRDIADYLDFVQCGFLLPITLQPGKEQEYSGTYMLRGSLPEGVRQVDLTYDFRILK